MRTEDLPPASKHYLYEARMLLMSVCALGQRVDETVEDIWKTTVQNALLESFAVHLRAVIDLLYQVKGERMRKTYNPKWTPPTMSPELIEAAERVNAEIMHVDPKWRINRENNKGWLVIRLADQARTAFNSWLTGVTMTLLDLDAHTEYREAEQVFTAMQSNRSYSTKTDCSTTTGHIQVHYPPPRDNLTSG